MICPRCGERTRVLRSEGMDALYARERECRVCGHRWVTVEAEVRCTSVYRLRQLVAGGYVQGARICDPAAEGITGPRESSASGAGTGPGGTPRP